MVCGELLTSVGTRKILRGKRASRPARSSGGEGGIRTPDTLPGMSAFEADRFNHSRTSPFALGLRNAEKHRLLRPRVCFARASGPCAGSGTRSLQARANELQSNFLLAYS